MSHDFPLDCYNGVNLPMTSLDLVPHKLVLPQMISILNSQLHGLRGHSQKYLASPIDGGSCWKQLY